MTTLYAVWGPFACEKCKKRFRNGEGRFLGDPEANVRGGIWCIDCWNKRKEDR